jgi:hypothetical protein
MSLFAARIMPEFSVRVRRQRADARAATATTLLSPGHVEVRSANPEQWRISSMASAKGT